MYVWWNSRIRGCRTRGCRMRLLFYEIAYFSVCFFLIYFYLTIWYIHVKSCFDVLLFYYISRTCTGYHFAPSSTRLLYFYFIWNPIIHYDYGRVVIALDFGSDFERKWVRLVCKRPRVRSPRPAHSFVETWSWKHFYGHSPSSTDSRRAVVSYWRKNVH